MSEWKFPSKGELPEDDSAVEYHDLDWDDWIVGGYLNGQFYDGEDGVCTDPKNVEKWRYWNE